MTRIYPLEEDAPILGLKDYSCEMNTEQVNLYRCPSLEELYYENIESLDITNNPNLRELTLHQTQIKAIDLRGNPLLKKLHVEMSKIESLNLTPCNKLEVLYCRMCFELKKISVSNQSRLRQVNLVDTSHLNDKSLHFLRQVVKQNNGLITTGEEG